MIAIYRNQLLRINSFEQRGHLLMISDGEIIYPNGTISCIRNWLIDPMRLKPLRASKIERTILEKALKYPRPSHSRRPKKEATIWEVVIKLHEVAEALRDRITFEAENAEILAVEGDRIYLRSFQRPSRIWGILKTDDGIWRLPTSIIKYRWIEAKDLPRKKERKKGGSSHERKK